VGSKHSALKLIEGLREVGTSPEFDARLQALLLWHAEKGGIQDPDRVGLDQAEYLIYSEVELLPDEVTEADSWFVREYTRLAKEYLNDDAS